MADKIGDSVNSGQFHVSHEISSDGFYQITVFEENTGKLCFSWAIPVSNAVEMAEVITEMVTEWKAEQHA